MVVPDRLPGIGRGRKRTGRHRRDLDALVRRVRATVGRDDAPLETQLVTLRGLADELDRLEFDDEHSAHTFALVARTYDDLRRPVLARFPTAAPTSGPLDDIDAHIAGALHDTPPA